MDLRVKLGGKVLPNPVGAASGVFGFGEEYEKFTDYTALGAVYTKAVTPQPREGNKPPRLAETPAGLINAIGLANPGLEEFLTKKVPFLEKLPCPVIVNAAGAVEGDYLQVVEAMEEVEAVWGSEINVSCPNVDQGGMAFGTDPGVLESLIKKIRRISTKPLLVKLSPNVTRIGETARAAEAAGADALSCVNTFTAMKIDVENRRPVLPRGTGGLSGPAILPLGVAAVWQVSQAVKIPIIGIGGIACAQDALEYLLAGAAGVQVGSALFANPLLPFQVLQGIKRYMEKNAFSSIADLHGHF